MGDSQISETLTRCWPLRGAASMGAAVSITRLDLTASELRKAASGEKISPAAGRQLALALVLDGVDRKTAAETCGMDRQTLRDWVHRYNAAGLAGLRNLKSPGPGSKLTARQQAELAELVEAGPDPAVHGVVRWRRVDLRGELERGFGVTVPGGTGSCVGGGSICATNCSGASVSRSTSVRSGRFWPSSATASCR